MYEFISVNSIVYCGLLRIGEYLTTNQFLGLSDSDNHDNSVPT